MTAGATSLNESLLPQPPGGTALGATLALGAHAALLLALFAMTQWRTQVPEVVSAELWSSVPELAAPAAASPAAPPAAPAPEPPTPTPAPAPAPPPAARTEPPPPRVDIATEQAEKARAQRAEQERLERERKEAEAARRRQAEAEKVEKAEKAEKAKREREQQLARQAAAAEQARVDKAREDQLRRMMTQAGGTSGATDAPATASSSAAGRGTAARDAAPSASYAARLAALIRSHIVFSGEVAGNPSAEVEVRAATSGTIISRRLIKSSGHPAWDDAVLRAIDRAGTLPRDTDGRVPSTLIIAFRPKE